MMRAQVTGRRRVTSAARRFLDAVEALANGLARQEGLTECAASAHKAPGWLTLASSAPLASRSRQRGYTFSAGLLCHTGPRAARGPAVLQGGL
jgi:hypothetical protein